MPAIATVTQTGLVTGVTSGTTYIRASSEGKTDSVPMLVRSLNAPTITAVSPVTWTPGAAATITGTNFAGDIASNIVQVNGVTATVTAASTTSISFIVPSATVLPCSPTGPIPITVSVAGDVTTGTANLAMATQRQLAVGESMLLSGAAEVGCNEFSATGGTYIVSAFNYATNYTQAVNFQLVGDQRLAIGHSAALKANIDFMNRHPNQRAVLQAKRARERAAFARAGVSLSSTVAPLPNVGDKSWKRMMKTFGNYNTFDSVRTRVVYVGPKLIIMEDSLSPLAGTMDSEYQAIGAEFDRDMYGYLSNFGDPLVLDSQTDDNGRVIAIFSKKVNDYTVGSGGSLLGFVTSCDFSPQVDPVPANACPPSNEGEYFYAFVPNPSGTGNGNWSLVDWRHYVRGTLLHEFKHVVMFAERIARDAGVFLLPIGASGGAAAEIATAILGSKLPATGPEAIRPTDAELQLLMDKSVERKAVLECVAAILERLGKAA
ncbi:MAG: IPT/TIG domain-containing protein [Rhodospirillaceae bacterium]|nr:IPT/TIG domain-containing protein [Rhodospirillaceae bacterium]